MTMRFQPSQVATQYLARMRENKAKEEQRIQAVVERAKAEGTLGETSPHFDGRITSQA